MQVTELLNKINFHDSCVNTLIYKNGIIILNIDLCMWQQTGYKAGEPELKEIILKFFNVTNYKWDSVKNETDIDYDTILDIMYKDNIVKIVMQDQEISILEFKCNSVLVYDYPRL